MSQVRSLFKNSLLRHAKCSHGYIKIPAVLSEKRTNSVYSIPCKDCDQVYVTQTSVCCTFNGIPKKQYLFLKTKTQLCRNRYACQANHATGWNNFQITTTHRWYHQRLCFEAWHINSAHAPLIHGDGRLLCTALIRINAD